jgi:hypothetical protein
MLAEHAQQLLELVATVPALAQSYGMTDMGSGTDPGGRKAPLPFAWVVLDESGTALDPNSPLPPALVKADVIYTVVLYVANTSQSDLISNQLPTVEAVVKAVHGQTSVTGAGRWVFRGLKLIGTNADRLTYACKFFVSAAFA